MAVETGTRAGPDSFLEALRSEKVAGNEILAAWVAHVLARNGIETLFEFETWLRGLYAFLDYRHLPLNPAEGPNLIGRNFEAEIRVAGLALQECERSALELCSLGQDAKVEPRAPVETKVYGPGVLDSQSGRMLEQSTPMDSLARLIESVHDLRVAIGAFKEPPGQTFQLFLTIGRMLHRDVRNARFVDMLLNQRLRLQYDRIDNAVLSGVLRSITEEHLRRNVALVLLHLYRFLHYLNHVSRALAEDRPLRRYLVVFSLLHEQTASLCDFIKSRFLKEKCAYPELRDAADLIIHSLKMETQRVLERELPFVASEGSASKVYARFENSHGLLRNCYQSGVVVLVQALDRGVDGKSLFPSMVESQQKGQKLQTYLWDLRQELRAEVERAAGLDLDRVLDRITQFRGLLLGNLMYQDLGEFESFSESLIAAGSQAEIIGLIRKFIGYLEVLSQEVSNRSALKDVSQTAGNPEVPELTPE